MSNYKGIRQLAIYTIAVFIITMLIWSLLPRFNINGVIDQITVIQLFLNVFLLIPSLLLLVNQIWQSQTSPRLDIEVRPIHDNAVLSNSLFIPEQGDQIQTLQFSLMNDGDAIALWYIVRIFIPKDLVSEVDDINLKPIVGTIPINWKASLPNKDHPNHFLLTFLSNGDFASYPLDGLILLQAHIKITSNRQYNTAYQIKYFVTSEKGTRQKERSYTLKMRPQSK